MLGSILPERMLDAGALVALFALLTALNVGDSPAGRAPAYIAGGLLVAFLGAMAVYLRLRMAGRLQGFADRVRPVAGASRLLLTRRGAELALATAVVWFAESVIFWLVGASTRAGHLVLESTLVVVLASFFALIPAAPGYVGTYDAAVLFALRRARRPRQRGDRRGAAVPARHLRARHHRGPRAHGRALRRPSSGSS